MLISTLSVVLVVRAAGMVLILSIHRFLVGNGVAAIVVCAWEKELAREKLKTILADA